MISLSRRAKPTVAHLLEPAIDLRPELAPIKAAVTLGCAAVIAGRAG